VTDAPREGITDRVVAALRSLRALGDRQSTQRALKPEPGLPGLLGAVGAALLASTSATNDVQDTLNELASRYGKPELRVFVLPTLILIEDPTTTPPQTAVFPAEGEPLRLDQVGAIDHIVRHALAEQPPPDDVIAQIAEVTAKSPRFGPFLTVLGHTLLTLGFGLVVNPALSALPVYAVLGVVVGTIVLYGSRISTLALILPVFTAFTVTVLVGLVARPLVDDNSLRLVAPSLVSFLPGLTLTIAAVELTSGQVMAGASRLVYGIARLGLLTFGVFAGLSVIEGTATSSSGSQLGAWAPWCGLLLVGLGYYMFESAPRGSLVWILYALVVAYAAQSLGNLLLGAELSGLVGALVVVPAVYLVARTPGAPPPSIMLTSAYWLLVPGSMGFIGLTEAASGTAGAAHTIMATLGSLLAIAIGMLLGGGLSKDATAVLKAWQHRSSRHAPRTALAARATTPNEHE